MTVTETAIFLPFGQVACLAMGSHVLLVYDARMRSGSTTIYRRGKMRIGKRTGVWFGEGR